MLTFCYVIINPYLTRTISISTVEFLVHLLWRSRQNNDAVIIQKIIKLKQTMLRNSTYNIFYVYIVRIIIRCRLNQVFFFYITKCLVDHITAMSCFSQTSVFSLFSKNPITKSCV